MNDQSKIHSSKMTRRRMLGHSARMAALAFAASLMPPNIRRVLAQEPPPRASLKDIRHVVILMQENRSFDHYFGTMAGVRGFDDPNAHILPDGRSVFHQPDPEHPDGFLLPFHLDTKKTNAQKLPSTNHSWHVQHESWNHGKMDNWVPAHRKADGANGPYVMGHHTRADIPFQFALAEAFTICDAYHCSMMGPTHPNRMYLMTGTIDPEGRYGGPIIHNDMPEGGFRWTTYPERLEKAGVSWKIYQKKDNFGCNVLEYFKQFRTADRNSRLYTRGMTHGAPDQFEHDAMNDKLPAVSWIIPAAHECEHPDYMPAAGAAYVASKIDAIAANPEVWARTVFILNYDENDGIFDHVVPPTPPPGTPHEFVKGLPIGAGFRVPCIVVSPWTVGGWVCSQSFDHTSPLQFLEKFTGVEEPNISDWRRKTFGDMTSVFRFNDAAAQPPVLPDTREPLIQAKYEAEHLPRPHAPSEQSMPSQEQGERKRVPPVA